MGVAASLKTEKPLITANISMDCYAKAATTYKNCNVGVITRLRTKILLIIEDISANWNGMAVVITKRGLFYLIFRSVFAFLLIEMVTKE